MLIHPWDGASPGEAEKWLASTAMFGQLVVNNLDPAQAPLVIPTHAVLEGQTLLIHLARPNPIWRHVEAAPRVRFTVVADYAYIPSTWRADAGGPDEDGVPTSYYSTVQFVCDAHIIDEPQAKADLLITQLRHLQPEGGYAPIGVGQPPSGRMLSGIRGLRLDIVEQVAKFKYDDHNPVDHRQRVTANLTERGQQHDHGAATQQSRRLAERGPWRARPAPADPSSPA